MRLRPGLFLALALVLAAARAAHASDSAVIFIYHRFGEDAYPTTSVRLDQFEAQIAELKSGGYSVLPVPEIVKATREGKPLPDLAVGISIDDAYESIYTRAWPRLKAAALPFTIFVATDPVDRGFADYMSWDQIRDLARQGVTIGAHSASHRHMADASPEEDRREIERSNARFKAELGFVPELFAYPYGETSLDVREIVKKSGYAAAFGQHSGAIGPKSDFFNLPRFSVNEHYGELSKFRERARALSLPVTDLEPADPLVRVNPPAIAFSLPPELDNAAALACFGGDGEKLAMTRDGDRIHVAVGHPLPPGRFRLSCTMAAGKGRYRWFGASFYVPGKTTAE